MKKEKSPNPIWNMIKTEWQYLGNQKKKFVLYLIFFVIAGIIALMRPLVIGLIFNSIQQNITSNAELKKLILMIFSLLAITIGFWIFHGIGRILEEMTGFKVNKNYVNSKIKKVLELPVEWHKDHHSGDTIDKINRGSWAISNFSQYATSSLVRGILNVFGSLIILAFIDWKISLFAFLSSMSLFFVITKTDKKLVIYYEKLNHYSNKVSSRIFDYISNIITVVTLRLKKTVSEEINERLNDSYNTHKKSVLIETFKWAGMNISLSLIIVLILSFKAYTDFTTNGLIMVGTLYIFYGYLQNITSTFFEFANLYGNILEQNTRITSAYPIDEAFENVKEGVKSKLPLNWKEISLKNIDFTYDREGKQQHIDKVNLKFKKGQKIALIGESGSGKSTILALMRGLYETHNGKIYCDSKLIDKGFNKLKHHITLIPQDPEIFNNTIRYNITMDFPTSKEEINEAISMAQFSSVVERLKKGLDTNVLEKGVSLSGGEKQRLALARGLLAAKKSEIILLDEPTSSVDSLNEMKIHENIFKKFKNKTIISSIHRLHLLNKFDYIYMFEKGKIVAHGTLAEIQMNPKFLHIWRKYRK